MSAERGTVNEKRLAEVITTILATKNENKFIFADGNRDPERLFINKLIEHGQKIGDPDFATNGVFLTTSLIRGNWTNRFFRKEMIYAPNFEKYAWIFEPKKVVESDSGSVERACLEFFKPAGYCKKAVDTWYYNCQVIEESGGSVRKLFDQFDGDAEESARAIYFRNRAKSWEKIKAGTFLNYGPHLAYLAVQWLSLYGLYDFKNIESLPIDFQLARILVQTDTYLPEGEQNVNQVIVKTLTPAFKKVCIENNLDPREVSQAFWAFGSNACNNKLHNSCPLEQICVRYITSKNYQDRGVISAEDEGRYDQVKKSSQPRLL